jgi:hypothetical protein
MKNKLRYAAVLGVMAVATASAWADEIRLKLSGGEEVPPVATSAAGEGALTVNPDMTVTGGITTTGIVATMAHIHLGKAGANGPVAITLTRNGDNGWVVPTGAKFTETQYQAYLAGDLYVNVHSAEHKGGEIRTQLSRPAMAAMPKAGGY